MRINPVALMTLILLVIFTGLFSVLAVVKTGAGRRYLDNGGDKSVKTNAELAKEIANLHGAMSAAEKNIAVRQQEVDRLDFLLASHGTFISPERGTLTAIATPGRSEEPILGQTAKLRDGNVRLAAARIEETAKRLDARAKEADAADRKRAPAIEDAVKKRQDELNEALRRISDQESAFNKERDELTKRLDDLAAAKDKAEKEQRQAHSTRATRVAQLEDKIRELLELQLRRVDELDPDGAVLQVAGDMAVIDLGSQDRIAPGMRFAVSATVNGRQVAKGMLEVVQASAAIATCRITQATDARRLPITPGDTVASPVYDRRHAPVFVLAGDFKRFSRQDIAMFIRNAGGTVAERLGPDCEFLVTGERSEREQSAARQFAVRAMDEDFLLRFLQPAYAPTAAR